MLGAGKPETSGTFFKKIVTRMPGYQSMSFWVCTTIVRKTNLYPVAFNFGSSLDTTFGSFEILELEDPGIITRKVLIGIPRACPHRP
jgi:hypothetical protein